MPRTEPATPLVGVCLLALQACSSAASDVPTTSASGVSTARAASGAPGASLGPDAVRGTVLDERLQQPLAGRIVAVGANRATTDGDGRFALGGVAPGYDIVVVEPNGSRATVYRGLRRRDLLLVHRSDGTERRAHRASLVGRVEGGPFSRTDWVVLNFVSPRTTQQLFLGGLPGPRPGPEYGPFDIRWNGPDALSGELFAVRTQRDAADAGPSHTSSWLAEKVVTLQDGQTMTVDLDPQPLPRLQTHVKVDAPGAYPTQVDEGFVFPAFRGYLAAGGVANPRGTSFDLDIFDARAFGGLPCADAAFGMGQWRFVRTCEIPLDAPAALTLHAPPAWKGPPAKSSFGPDTIFAWSPSDSPIYELELRDSLPTPTDPAIDVFTTDTTSTWPDLRALGVGFPSGSASYYVKIAARGPYATMDETCGPDGVGARFPKEIWLSESTSVELHVEPPQPVGSATAQCQYPQGAAIVCGEIPNNVEQNKEFYVLSAINNKLRHFPQFADAVGIHCVRDCEGARAYVKAYAEYARSHPGFDANEPLEMGPPPPRP